jgi:hypothetical protein
MSASVSRLSAPSAPSSSTAEKQDSGFGIQDSGFRRHFSSQSSALSRQPSAFSERDGNQSASGCAGEAVVFGVALLSEQDPERVDAKGGAEGRVEEQKEAEHDG